jgi:hypothetical protein
LLFELCEVGHILRATDRPFVCVEECFAQEKDGQLVQLRWHFGCKCLIGVEQLSFEERAKLAAWLHGWNDDKWDEQMKRDVASGMLHSVLHEVEEDIKAGRVREMP